MGSRIAAHLTNAGIPVVMLDIVPPGTDASTPKPERNKIVLAALDGLKKSKPAAFYSPDNARLLTLGNFDDDLALIADCDWIIEVVAENMEIKRALLDKVQQHRRADSIITSNTSGLPIHEIVEGMPMQLRRHWFGTHFFNPPRYMRLLEVIPTPDSDPADIATIEHLCDLRLGKAIVHAHDTPNFIANRIGTFSMSNAIRLMQAQNLTIEEVDTLTGTPLGWPKTGTFRLGDMVGVDVMAHVAKNFAAQAAKIGDERADVGMAPFVGTMIERKWLGDKAKQGFYKKEGLDVEAVDVGSGTRQAAAIMGGSAVNIIARECVFDWDLRTLPDEDAAALKARLDRFISGDLLPRMRAVYQEAAVDTETIVAVPPLVPQPGSPAETLARRLTGLNTTTTVSFATSPPGVSS